MSLKAGSAGSESGGSVVESLGGEHNVSGRSSAYGDTGHEPTTTTLREGAAALPSTMQVRLLTVVVAELVRGSWYRLRLGSGCLTWSSWSVFPGSSQANSYCIYKFICKLLLFSFLLHTFKGTNEQQKYIKKKKNLFEFDFVVLVMCIIIHLNVSS